MKTFANFNPIYETVLEFYETVLEFYENGLAKSFNFR